jgi:hypothetical protein
MTAISNEMVERGAIRLAELDLGHGIWSTLTETRKLLFAFRFQTALNAALEGSVAVPGLEAENALLRQALQPFANIAPFVEYTDHRDGEIVHRQFDRDGKKVELVKEDFRRAARALPRQERGTGS